MDGQAKRESQISNAFARLDKSIDELSNVVIRHEENLVSVLRPNESEKQLVGEMDKQEAQVPIATSLNNFNARVQNVINKLNSVQRRLEL